MKDVLNLVILLLKTLTSESNVAVVIDATLKIVGEILGIDSTGYKLLSLVLNHAREHGCIAELLDALLEMFAFSTSPYSNGYTVTYAAPLAAIEDELTQLRELAIAA